MQVGHIKEPAKVWWLSKDFYKLRSKPVHDKYDTTWSKGRSDSVERDGADNLIIWERQKEATR